MSAQAARVVRSPSADPHPRLSVAAVAAHLGVAPATLRTWDRRYGLGPAEHATGNHRRYDSRDVARLRLMTHAVLRGASVADAARYALGADPAMLGALIAEAHRTAAPGSATGCAAMWVDVDSGQARQLAAAAAALDTDAMQRQLSRSVTERGITQTWELILRPVLAAAGDLWATTGTGTEIEHLLSECVIAVLSNGVVKPTPDPTHTPVLLAGLSGEQHDLPLRVLAAALTERAVPLIMLGKDTPVPALAATVHAREPSAVFLWAEMDRSADRHVLDQLPPNRYVLGGPAWDRIPLPADAHVVRHLAEATDRLAQCSSGR